VLGGEGAPRPSPHPAVDESLSVVVGQVTLPVRREIGDSLVANLEARPGFAHVSTVLLCEDPAGQRDAESDACLTGQRPRLMTLFCRRYLGSRLGGDDPSGLRSAARRSLIIAQRAPRQGVADVLSTLIGKLPTQESQADRSRVSSVCTRRGRMGRCCSGLSVMVRGFSPRLI
jgi:hypothetical protein